MLVNLCFVSTPIHMEYTPWYAGCVVHRNYHWDTHFVVCLHQWTQSHTSRERWETHFICADTCLQQHWETQIAVHLLGFWLTFINTKNTRWFARSVTLKNIPCCLPQSMLKNTFCLLCFRLNQHWRQKTKQKLSRPPSLTLPKDVVICLWCYPSASATEKAHLCLLFRLPILQKEMKIK